MKIESYSSQVVLITGCASVVVVSKQHDGPRRCAKASVSRALHGRALDEASGVRSASWQGGADYDAGYFGAMPIGPSQAGVQSRAAQPAVGMRPCYHWRRWLAAASQP